LLVAHLPGVAQLASLLTTEHVDLDLIFSPGTMAVVQMECDSWKHCDYGVGALTLFLPPMLHLP
jgi:phosphohistidine phosphatase SixA